MLGGALDGTATSFDPSAASGSCSVSRRRSTQPPRRAPMCTRAGFLTTIGGQPRHHLMGLEPASGAATSFSSEPQRQHPRPGLIGLGFDCLRGGEALPSSVGSRATLWLGSSWLTALPRRSILILTPLPAQPGSPPLRSTWRAASSLIGGLVRHSIAALNATDALAIISDRMPDSDGQRHHIYALSVTGSTVYAGGFSYIDRRPTAQLHCCA